MAATIDDVRLKLAEADAIAQQIEAVLAADPKLEKAAVTGPAKWAKWYRTDFVGFKAMIDDPFAASAGPAAFDEWYKAAALYATQFGEKLGKWGSGETDLPEWVVPVAAGLAFALLATIALSRLKQ